MCCGPDDYTYSAYGGKWQRDDPVEGRVGSVFAPAGAMVITDADADGETATDAAVSDPAREPAPDDATGEAPEISGGHSIRIEQQDTEENQSRS